MSACRDDLERIQQCMHDHRNVCHRWWGPIEVEQGPAQTLVATQEGSIDAGESPCR